MMKNRVIVSVLYIGIGVLLYWIPTQLFPVCNSEEMKMACYYTGQAEIGLGIFIAVLGIVSLLTKKSSIRTGISLAQIGAGILVFLYPEKLIGLCKMGNMPCRIRTFPALLIMGTVLIVISIVNVLYLIRKDKKNNA